MAFEVTQQLSEIIADGTLDLDDATADRYKAALCNSDLSWANTNTVYSNISAHIAGNASVNPISLVNVEYNRSAANSTWQSDQLVFTASGGVMTGRYVVIFDSVDGSASANDPIIGAFDLGADEAVADTGTLTVRKSGTTNVEYFTLRG